MDRLVKNRWTGFWLSGKIDGQALFSTRYSGCTGYLKPGTIDGQPVRAGSDRVGGHGFELSVHHDAPHHLKSRVRIYRDNLLITKLREFIEVERVY